MGCWSRLGLGRAMQKGGLGFLPTHPFWCQTSQHIPPHLTHTPHSPSSRRLLPLTPSPPPPPHTLLPKHPFHHSHPFLTPPSPPPTSYPSGWLPATRGQFITPSAQHS